MCAIHTTWQFRMKGFGIIMMANMVLMTLAFAVSSVSYLRNGDLWKPIVKGILINLTLWFILAIILVIG